MVTGESCGKAFFLRTEYLSNSFPLLSLLSSSLILFLSLLHLFFFRLYSRRLSNGFPKAYIAVLLFHMQMHVSVAIGHRCRRASVNDFLCICFTILNRKRPSVYTHAHLHTHKQRHVHAHTQRHTQTNTLADTNKKES